MNSKKKLAVSGFMFFFILLQQVSFAQPFSYLSPNFNITLQPINTAPPPRSSAPYYTLFIETGNGRYFKIPNITNTSTIDGTTQTTNSYPYLFKIENGSRAIATVSGWYDTTPRPPRDMSIIASNPNGQLLSNQVNLSQTAPNKPKIRIALDPCVSIIVPGDTMVAALTYKPFTTAGYKTIVAFFYNKQYDGGNIFTPIDSQTPFYFNSTEQTLAIRSINHELISITAPTLPTNVAQLLSTTKTGYSNAIYFSVPDPIPGTDETEKNIFLSLVPTSDISKYSPAISAINPTSSTRISAIIITYNGNTIVDQQPIAPTLGVNMYARDPNGIIIYPQCLENAYRDPYNKLVPVTLNFENDGPGIAMTVVDTVTLPDGIKIPTLLTDARIIKNGPPQPIKPWPTNEKNYYKISGRKIIFVLNNIGLMGTGEPDREKRKGTILFTLSTVSASPPSIKECMYFDLSIAFRNRDGSWNPPVRKSALMRLHCFSADFACPRIVKLPDPR